MAHKKNTTNLTELLLQCVTQPDPMLSMLEWLCTHLMEAEVDQQLGQIKHDREVNFSLSNLENAIESVMAYAILLIAQYGYRNSLWNEKLGKVIDVHKEPLWNIRDFYIPKRNNDSTYHEQEFFNVH